MPNSPHRVFRKATNPPRIDPERFSILTQGAKNVKIGYPQNPGEKDP
jgi:hypothetical protein